MSTSLVLTCEVHGPDVEPFDIAGRKFCALCLRDYLFTTSVRELKMAEVKNEPRKRRQPEAGEEFECRHCGTIWEVKKGRACPTCGKDALG